MTDFGKLRKEYEDQGIRKADLDSDPFSEFDQWLNRAIECSPGKWFEANAMTLSTSDGQGLVTSRTVLLKQHSRAGLVFFTNYFSEKARQLEQCSQAALLFHWHYLGQQVRVIGDVEKTSREVSQEYFHSRPRGSQMGAAASQQSNILQDRQELEQSVRQLEQELDDKEVPLPEDWGGYCLKPVRFEFWQGRTNRLHDRIRYQLESHSGDAKWSMDRLAP